MAYYQDVVVEYLREKRWMFTNTECCIQLNPGNPDTSGSHWYCDAVAVDLSAQPHAAVYLCEVTYAKEPNALFKRLSEWNASWEGVVTAIRRDSKIPEQWSVTPWIFVPEKFKTKAEKKLKALHPVPGSPGAMPYPKITSLESIVPWNPERFAAMEAAHSDLIEDTKES